MCPSHPARSKEPQASKRTQQHNQVKELLQSPPPRRVADAAPWWAGLKESLETLSGPSALFEKLHGNRPSRQCSAPGRNGPLFKTPLRRLLAAAPLCSALLMAVAPLGAMANAPKTGTGQAYAVAQVSSIEDFNDNLPISPDHWAYGRLSELVERNCVAGFPDKTFRGDQRATRYEVAAFLESCLASAPLELRSNEENQKDSQNILPLIVPLVSINIIAFIILCILVYYLMRLHRLERNVEKISQRTRSRLEIKLALTAAALTILSALFSLWGTQSQKRQTQPQKAGPTTVLQETALRETMDNFPMGHNPDHLPAKHNTLAVIPSLPESASANSQGLLAHGAPPASPLAQTHQKPEAPRILQT